MKKSEFVKEIKNYIYEILSEDSTTIIASTSQDEENAVKANPKITGDVKKGALDALKSAKPGQQITIPVSEEVQSTDPAVKKIEDKMEKDPEFLKKTKEAMAKAEKGDTTDLAMMMAGFGKMFESEEDKEPTKAELEKEKVKGAPSKFKVSNSEFEDFKDKLKNLVKKIKAMESGEEKTKKMAALKQFIKKPELVKAFKERDVKIDTGGLID